MKHIATISRKTPAKAQGLLTKGAWLEQRAPGSAVGPSGTFGINNLGDWAFAAAEIAEVKLGNLVPTDLE
jgi:hypothetical protein